MLDAPNTGADVAAVAPTIGATAAVPPNDRVELVVAGVPNVRDAPGAADVAPMNESMCKYEPRIL